MTPIMPRSAWTSTTAKSPAALVASRVEGPAIHWDGPAVPAAVNAGDEKAVAAFLRGIRDFHVNGHGWSDIAYQWAVDQAGRRWVLRGWRLQSAANGDQDVNQRYGAIVGLIGVGQKPTPAMLDGLADAVADFRRTYPHATKLVTHNDVRPHATDCPGPDLTAWVRAGGPREDDMPSVEDILNAPIPVNDKGDPPWRFVTSMRYLVRHAREQSQQLAAQGAALEVVTGLLSKGDPVTADELRAVVREEIAKAVIKVDVSVEGAQA